MTENFSQSGMPEMPQMREPEMVRTTYDSNKMKQALIKGMKETSKIDLDLEHHPQGLSWKKLRNTIAVVFKWISEG